LTSILGRTTIRAATGIPRLNLKGKSYGETKERRVSPNVVGPGISINSSEEHAFARALEQAKEYLAKRVIELRETRLYGTRELRSFRSAATKYLLDYKHKKRIKDDALQLRQLDTFIGGLELKQVHMGSLQDFIAKRRQDGVKTKTLNMSRRLRAAGVLFEDRQDLLGHRSGRITTHYSQAELTILIEASEKVCDTEPRKTPATTWLRRKTG
jgi:hypothetical protein